MALEGERNDQIWILRENPLTEVKQIGGEPC